jgi:hypothetical protein
MFGVLRFDDPVPQYCLNTCIAEDNISGGLYRHARHGVIVLQGSSEESLCRGRVTPIGQEKVNSLPGRIDGAVEVAISSFDPDIRFIQSPASVRALQMWPTTFIQFRAIHLNPPPDATGCNCQSSLGSHFGQVREGNRIPKIPSYAPQDHVAMIVAPFKGI